jgi:hypothetical protein
MTRTSGATCARGVWMNFRVVYSEPEGVIERLIFWRPTSVFARDISNAISDNLNSRRLAETAAPLSDGDDNGKETNKTNHVHPSMRAYVCACMSVCLSIPSLPPSPDSGDHLFLRLGILQNPLSLQPPPRLLERPSLDPIPFASATFPSPSTKPRKTGKLTTYPASKRTQPQTQ